MPGRDPFDSQQVEQHQHEPHPHQRHQPNSLHVQQPLIPVVGSAMTLVFHNTPVPVFVVLNGAAASVVPYALQVDPHRNDYDVAESHHRTVDGVKKLEISTQNVDENAGSSDNEVVKNLLQTESGGQVNLKHLKEANPE